MYYYPGYARLPSYRGAHGKQGINSCRYPFTTPGLRETIVDKMPCLGAHALSGTRTRDPLITSREHEPIHHSAPTLNLFKINEKCYFSVISWPILILFVLSDRAWCGLQNFYTEFWNSLFMQIQNQWEMLLLCHFLADLDSVCFIW